MLSCGGDLVGKNTVYYVCQECGYDSFKWLGKCPGCDNWNTFVQELSIKKGKKDNLPLKVDSMPQPITSIDLTTQKRYETGWHEFDRVLGGGVVPGSLVLLGGDPGIGKSTLILQALHKLGEHTGTVFYVSGEESTGQLRMHAERLGVLSDTILCLAETNLDVIESHISKLLPKCVVIDSIQTMYIPDISSAPGSVSQVRECTGNLLKIAKTTGIPIFIIGHVTKSGTLAGPKILEHMVDTVLQFEGDTHHVYRILRAIKNRFGSTHEIGIFEMNDKGLSEVANPSKIFLSEVALRRPGSTVVCTVEGTRPLLVEVQALVGATAYGGTPRRLATGLDYNRVSIILAVLERCVGLQLSGDDIYLNAVGGVKLEEPGADLAIAVAAASSFKNIPCDPHTVIIGEVGLAGEVRGVGKVESRVKEAAKLGFHSCIIPQSNRETIGNIKNINIIGVNTLQSALGSILRKEER